MKRINLQKHLTTGMRRGFKIQSPRIELANGGSMSVQASGTHYCRPRHDTGPYTHAEVGFPTGLTDESYALLGENDDTVWGWVGIGTIAKIIKLNGGVK